MQRVIAAVTCLAWVLGASLVAAAPCIVSIHPYDQKGNRLDSVISDALYLPDDNRAFVLPKLRKSRIRIEKGRLILPIAPDAGQPIQVVINVKGGGRIVETFEFVHCGQRFSFANGLSEEGGGEGFSFIHGGLSGCVEYVDWWVRMMPMFSFGSQVPIPEADVDVKSGKFTVQGFIRGIRHILVVGRGSEALQAVGVNVVSGGAVAVQALDVSGQCKAPRIVR
jgi:hypothetical protein